MTCTLTKYQCDRLVELAKAHQRKDEYIQGTYEETGLKREWVGGCAIGCTIYDAYRLDIMFDDDGFDDDFGRDYGDHAGLAKATGVDRGVWELVDALFERQRPEAAVSWPAKVLAELRPGIDYSGVPNLFYAGVLKRLSPLVGPDLRIVIDRLLPRLIEPGLTLTNSLDDIAIFEGVDQTVCTDTTARFVADLAYYLARDMYWQASNQIATGHLDYDVVIDMCETFLRLLHEAA